MAWTDRYVDASASGSGTGTSPADPWTLAEAVSNSTGGMRVNFKAGTYGYSSDLNTSATTSLSSPLWWRGYKTTAGDLDSKPVEDLVDATDLPLLESTNKYIQLGQSYTHLTGLSFRQNGNGRPAIFDRRGKSLTKNCRFHSTYTSSTPQAVIHNQTQDAIMYLNCDIIQDSTAATQAFAYTRGYSQFYGCRFKGAGSGTSASAAYSMHFHRCVFDSMNIGVQLSQPSTLFGNVFYNTTDDAIYYNSTNSNGSSVVGNVFHSVGGYCIGGVSDNTGFLISNNSYYNSSNKFEFIPENLEFDAVAESSDPFTDAANGDFSLVLGASSYGDGYGLMLGTSSTDYSDIGAIQHQDPSGGGGSTVHPLYAN